MIYKYRDAFSLRDEIGTCPSIEIYIDVTDKTPIFIRPYHAISSDDKLLDLEKELSRIKWTIIGLSEVWLKSKGCIILNNTGHTMYYSSGNECQWGVGFAVNKSIAGNVVNFKGQSDRVAELTIIINQWYQLKCIQVYMPTCSHPDDEVEHVYEDVDNSLSNSRAHYNIVMGDFNAKVGPRQCMEKCTGQYGLGERN